VTQVFASAINADRCEVDCLHPDAIRLVLGRSLGGDGSRAVADLFAVLADPSRSRILHLLAISERELCVCDMALVLGMSVSALSHQLRALRERGAVSRRKAGRIAYYRLVDDHLRRLVLDAAVHVAEATA
jgi:ArsR family transcriptional regulator